MLDAGILLERLAQAVVSNDTGLQTGPHSLADADGERIIGWVIEVGVESDPSYITFTVEEPTIAAAGEKALNTLARVARQRRIREYEERERRGHNDAS